jgi:hypothetical protein
MYTYVQNNPTTLTDPSGEFNLLTSLLEAVTPFVSEALDAGSYLVKEVTTWRKPKPASDDPLVLVVSSNTQFDSARAGVKQRDIVYSVWTANGDKPTGKDTSGHKVSLDEKKTAGNDNPGLEHGEHKFANEYDDNIRVTSPGLWFNVTQTWYIDGKQATIYANDPDTKSVVSGTHVYVEATESNVNVTYGH